MRLVILESPFAGDITRNVAYARAAMADCLRRGEAPIASHLLYTQPGVLDDDKPDERRLGIDAGLAWGRVADAAVFYADFGWSQGMLGALERHQAEGRTVEERRLPGWAEAENAGFWTARAKERGETFAPTAPADPWKGHENDPMRPLGAIAGTTHAALPDNPTDGQVLAREWLGEGDHQ